MDDLIVSGQTKSEKNSLISLLSTCLKIKNLGIPTKFLGIRMNLEAENEVTMNQSLLAEKLLEQLRMKNCRTADGSDVPTISYKDRIHAPR